MSDTVAARMLDKRGVVYQTAYTPPQPPTRDLAEPQVRGLCE
jgi:hypothetical protein